MSKVSRRLIVLSALVILVATAVGWLYRKWQDRPPISELGWPVAETGTATVGEPGGRVTVTWLGISSLLFDDGETQILVDGTFSRPSTTDILLQRPIWSDVPTINRALAEFRMNRVAAIVPVHAHFDHAMDAGLVANRTSAMIIGSESAANIARGAGVPVSQYQILADGESRRFGAFTLTLIASRHAPIGPGDDGWFNGVISEPLRQPARVMDWLGGVSWSVLVGHPSGVTLVQASGGFVAGALPPGSADVVMLGIGGLAALGGEYLEQYWDETVLQTGASQVYPVHYDDFTRPFGEVRLFPTLVDDVVVTARRLDELAAASDPPVAIRRLPFGQPVLLYAEGDGDVAP